MCVFCKIINKEFSSYQIYEDEICLAFLDITQATFGHTLIVPKRHYQNLLDIDSDVLAHLINVTQKIALHYKKILNPDGFNILNNCNEVAGQTVNHFHIHLIPRYINDNLTQMVFINNSSEICLSEVHEKLKF